jgi:single-stranded DNA-binding protein
LYLKSKELLIMLVKAFDDDKTWAASELKSGDEVVIVGRLCFEPWCTPKGEYRSQLSIHVERIDIIGESDCSDAA